MFNIAALSASSLTGPRSILRLVHLLSRLSAYPQGQTLSQLCAGLGLPKTTLFTMLKVLESAHYLSNHDGVYRLGPEAVALGAAMAQSPRRNFPECARDTLRALSQRTGETCFLAVLTPDRQFCKYVAAVEADNWLRFTVKLGSLKPAYATGSGRAMLAQLPAAEIARLVEGYSFDKLTSQTVSSRRKLLTSLREVREKGVSTVDGGTVAGVTAVAAAIFGSNGEVEAAITAGGPTSRVAARLGSIENAVREAAGDISRILGYRDPAQT